MKVEDENEGIGEVKGEGEEMKKKWKKRKLLPRKNPKVKFSQFRHKIGYPDSVSGNKREIK